MTSPREEAAVSQAIELLLDCTTARERSRVLIETLIGSGFCRSAALWRQVGRGDVRAWHPILARGNAAYLPTLEELRGVVAGDLAEELGGGRFVVLPIGHVEFALTLSVPAHDTSSRETEEDLDGAEALFQVWLAVEMAEASELGTDLLDALPGLHGGSTAGAAAAPQDTPRAASGHTAYELSTFLEREASWQLGPSVAFGLEVEDLPPLKANPVQFEGCLRELLASAAAGWSQRVGRVRVRVEAASEAAPGALVHLEDDAGWPPSLEASGSARQSAGLFSAARTIDAVGGSLKLDQSPLGGMRVTVWIPRG
jgi:hypothetical protein